MTKKKADLLGVLDGPGALAWTGQELVEGELDLGSDLDGLTIDQRNFTGAVVDALENFHGSMAGRAAKGEAAAVIKWLEDAAKNVSKAVADGRLRAPPAFHAAPALDMAAAKWGHEDWRAVVESRDLIDTRRCLITAAESLRNAPMFRARAAETHGVADPEGIAFFAKRIAGDGRPSSLPRDVFLSTVIEMLKAGGLPVSKARERADSILVKCGVRSPGKDSSDDQDQAQAHHSIARAARRAKPSKKHTG